MPNIDWRGLQDGTPPSRPTDPDETTDLPMPKGNEWRGLDDGTPPSKPTDPDKA
jgi:hypothetical protein